MQRTGDSEGASHSDNDMPKENTMSSISGLLQNNKPLVTTRLDEMVSAAGAQMTGADVGAVMVLDELGRIPASSPSASRKFLPASQSGLDCAEENQK
jgi:hypothetical protein